MRSTITRAVHCSLLLSVAGTGCVTTLKPQVTEYHPPTRVSDDPAVRGDWEHLPPAPPPGPGAIPDEELAPLLEHAQGARPDDFALPAGGSQSVRLDAAQAGRLFVRADWHGKGGPLALSLGSPATGPRSEAHRSADDRGVVTLVADVPAGAVIVQVKNEGAVETGASVELLVVPAAGDSR